MLASFTIDWVTLACHQAYAQGDQNALRRNGAIEYEAERLSAIPEPILFYGPYIPLAAGVYLLGFKGRLDGTLALDFAHGRGRSFKATSLDGFIDPICLVITKPLEDFEVRGVRTPLLKSLRLEGIEVERIYTEPVR